MTAKGESADFIVGSMFLLTSLYSLVGVHILGRPTTTVGHVVYYACYVEKRNELTIYS